MKQQKQKAILSILEQKIHYYIVKRQNSQWHCTDYGDIHLCGDHPPHSDGYYSELKTTIWAFIDSYPETLRYQLILASHLLMQQTFKLPANIKLEEYEKRPLIASSLPKIFHTDDPLAFDYICPVASLTSDEQMQSWQIFACQQTWINNLLAIFEVRNKKIEFIGVPFEFVDLPSENFLSQLPLQLCQQPLQGINFLPWRFNAHRSKQKNTLIMLVSYFFIVSLTIIFSWHALQQSLNQSLVTNVQADDQRLRLIAQLTRVLEMDKAILVLEAQIIRTKSYQKKVNNLIKQLIYLGEVIPNGTWLGSFEYNNHRIQLKGASFLYPAIIELSNRLDHHQFIDQSQLEAIRKQDYLLHFEINLSLNCDGEGLTQNGE